MNVLRRTAPLSRRTFLRGLGASVGLPLLDAMSPARSLAAASAGSSAAALSGAAAGVAPPVRVAVLLFPNGCWQDSWIPKETGFDYAMPFSLEPLERVRDEVLVISNLDKANSRGGDGHYAKTANFLTGMPVTKTTGKDIGAGGVSLDQLLASRVGRMTPIPSLELGVDPIVSGVDSNVGYTRLYASYISWRDERTPVAREINPRFVYERLFGAGASDDAARKRMRRDRSLLDLVLEDGKDLRGKLGRDDQHKLDEYMESLRAVERRIEHHERPDARMWRPEVSLADLRSDEPDGIPGDYREHVRLMLDLMTIAFRTDTTRVSTFMFANSVSGRGFPWVEGVTDGHHHVSHHENDPHKIEQYRRIVRWHVERFAEFVENLAAIPEGEGRLLDSSLVLMGSEMSDGNRHDPSNLPILLGGRGGGRVLPGRHIATPRNTPLCNLYLSMLDAAGMPLERFGDSVEPLRLV